MSRNRNTDIAGKQFANTTVEAVWNKGAEISGRDSKLWRRDMCGHIIKRVDYGNTKSEYGWEVDHKKPVAKQGSDDLSNLQPLYWETNRDKSDAFPWQC
jgi:hypothetical protein